MKTKTARKSRKPKRRPVKPSAVPNPEFNLHHPEIAHMIEPSIKAGGKQFYKFKEEFRIPAGRYKYIYASLKENDLRMSLDTLKEYVDAFKKVLSGGGKKNTISLEDLWKLVLNLESRISLGFDPQAVERLASIVHFDESEDLSTFDRKYGADKVELWKREGVTDFFLTKPIGDLLNLSDTSLTSLQDYIKTSLEIIEELDLGLQKVSQENS
jgi:hypothetical protein